MVENMETPDGLEEHVRALVRSPSPRKRVVGLVHAARRRLPCAVSVALRALETDPDEDVRSTAAWVLDVVGAAEALPALVRALYDDTFTVRSSAGWALVHLGQNGHETSVVTEMDTVLRSARRPPPREMARLVLGYLGTPSAKSTLADAPLEPCLH
jgi:hypothetical protein